MTPSLPPTDFSRLRISPEPAPVDPELAASAQTLRLAPARPELIHRPQPRATAVSRPRTRTAEAPSRLSASKAIGLAAIVAGTLWLVPAPGHRAADATLAGTHARPSELRAQATRQARAAHIYTWSAVPGAQTYEVRIVRGADVVFEATSTELAITVPAKLRLAPGRYTWSVTPTFTSRSPASATRPVVEGNFVVARR